MEPLLTQLGLPELLLLQLMVLAVSAAAGIVAFGFAMAVTPFFLIFLDARLVIEMNIVLTAVLFATVLPQVRRHIIPATLAAMLMGGALGIYPGLLVLQSLPQEALSLILTSVVIITALLAAFNRFPYFQREKTAGGVVGFVFTFINAGLALGGPIPALFGLNQRWLRDQMRAMLSSFFLVTGLAIIGAHVASGRLGQQEFFSALLFVPALLLGSFIASRLAGRINEVLFRKLVVVVLLATSFGILGREIAAAL